MSVLFIVAVLIFKSFRVTGRGGVIDGKWDFNRNSMVSMPGSVAVPSGFLVLLKNCFSFFSSIFLSVFMDSVESCLVLKSLQSSILALRQSFL